MTCGGERSIPGYCCFIALVYALGVFVLGLAGYTVLPAHVFVGKEEWNYTRGIMDPLGEMHAEELDLAERESARWGWLAGRVREERQAYVRRCLELGLVVLTPIALGGWWRRWRWRQARSIPGEG